MIKLKQINKWGSNWMKKKKNRHIHSLTRIRERKDREKEKVWAVSIHGYCCNVLNIKR